MSQASLNVERKLNFSAGVELNRTMGNDLAARLTYQLKRGPHWKLKAGLSCAWPGQIEALFVEAGYEKIAASHWGAGLKLLANPYWSYAKATTSLIPSLRWDNGKWFGEFGWNLRFLNGRFGLPAIGGVSGLFQVVPYFGAGIRFPLQDERLQITLEWKNFTEMFVDNAGSWHVALTGSWAAGKDIYLVGRAGVWQSGWSGLAAIYYKTEISAGIEVRL